MRDDRSTDRKHEVEQYRTHFLANVKNPKQNAIYDTNANNCALHIKAITSADGIAENSINLPKYPSCDE